MFSERLKNLKPYAPGEQPQDRRYLKLNTNENPYPPTKKISAFLKEFDVEKLRLYSDPLSEDLRECIANRYGVTKDQIFISNGSDEALSFCFYAFFDNEAGKLLFPEFTYGFYPVYCNFYNLKYKVVPLKKDFSIDMDSFLDEKRSCGIIFANPNAPTGICLPLDKLEYLLKNYPEDKAIIVDEAYVDFGGESALTILNQYKNLIVVRTFSKSLSLAGLRLGYVFANNSLIDALFTVKDSFNSYPADMLSQLIGKIAISDVEYYDSITKKIIATRDSFFESLKKLEWNVLPSKANFLFASKEGFSGKEIYQILKQNGILVRYFDIDGIKDFVRITIGTKEDMDRLLDEIRRLF